MRHLGLLGALVLAGCGSNALSNSQLQSQVSQICKATEMRMNRVPMPVSPAASVTFLERGADPVRALQHLQRRLGPLESQENDGWQALELPACMSR